MLLLGMVIKLLIGEIKVITKKMEFAHVKQLLDAPKAYVDVSCFVLNYRFI